MIGNSTLMLILRKKDLLLEKIFKVLIAENSYTHNGHKFSTLMMSSLAYNIFMNFYVEAGLLQLISWIYVKIQYKNTLKAHRRQRNIST